VKWSSETLAYRRVGGRDLLAEVCFPEGAEASGPVILWVHGGGGLIFGSRKEIAPARLDKWLMNEFVVVAIDYRWARGTELPELFTDIEAADGWVRAEGPRLWGGDPERVACVGHSAGAYLGLSIRWLLPGRPRPLAVVSLYGYGDIGGRWYTVPDAHYSSLGRVAQNDAYSVVGNSGISDAPGSSRLSHF